MQELAKTSDDNGNDILIFDFSKISHVNYLPFFSALPSVLHKKSKDVTFSTELLAEMNKTGNEQNHDLIQNSIAIQNPTYISYLIKIICRVLPTTKS
jgi:hypothetical protein